jgi:hypothetical protein
MRALVTLPLLVVVALACGRSETPAPAPQASPPVSAPAPAAPPARVGAIELGTAIGADGRVTTPGAIFSPADTIYASVLTENQPSGAKLSARWTYEDGQVVAEGVETLTAAGRANTEFHIAKPDGWPAGRYRVEIALNGAPAGAREFEVR